MTEAGKEKLILLIWDKLIIVVIVAGFSTLFKCQYDSHITRLHTERDAFLKTVETRENILLDSVSTLNESNLMLLESTLQEIQDSLNFSRELEKIDYKFEQRIIELDSSLSRDLFFLQNEVKADFQRKKDENNLEYISKQLSDFYWPIYYKLEENNSIYRLLNDPLLGDQIDDNVLNNHLTIVKILEDNIHLAQPDDAMIKEVKKYISHVYTYQSLRENSIKELPGTFNIDYPNDFFEIIKRRTEFYQAQYDTIIGVTSTLFPSSGNKLFHDSNSVTKNAFTELKDSLYSDTYTKKTYTLKLSWVDKFYFQELDQYRILFIDYSVEEKKAAIHIYKSKTDSTDNLFIDSFTIGLNETYWYIDNDGRTNYKITLNDVYESRERVLGVFFRERIRAKISVESWNAY